MRTLSSTERSREEPDVLERARDAEAVIAARVPARRSPRRRRGSRPPSAVHAGDEVEHRGLARAVGADERRPARRLEAQVEVGDGGRARRSAASARASRAGATLIRAAGSPGRARSPAARASGGSRRPMIPRGRKIIASDAGASGMHARSARTPQLRIPMNRRAAGRSPREPEEAAGATAERPQRLEEHGVGAAPRTEPRIEPMPPR